MSESWKWIVGFEYLYAISNRGKVRSVSKKVPFKSKRGNWHERTTRTKPLSTHIINSGYLVAHLNHRGKTTTRTVHSLVARAFIGPCPKGKEVAHNNGDKLDNRSGNLRYATRTENHADKCRHGTHVCGSRIPRAVLHERDIPRLRKLQGKISGYLAAKQMGVSHSTVYRVWTRESWRHV